MSIAHPTRRLDSSNSGASEIVELCTTSLISEDAEFLSAVAIDDEMATAVQNENNRRRGDILSATENAVRGVSFFGVGVMGGLSKVARSRVDETSTGSQALPSTPSAASVSIKFISVEYDAVQDWPVRFDANTFGTSPRGALTWIGSFRTVFATIKDVGFRTAWRDGQLRFRAAATVDTQSPEVDPLEGRLTSGLAVSAWTGDGASLNRLAGFSTSNATSSPRRGSVTTGDHEGERFAKRGDSQTGDLGSGARDDDGVSSTWLGEAQATSSADSSSRSEMGITLAAGDQDVDLLDVNSTSASSVDPGIEDGTTSTWSCEPLAPSSAGSCGLDSVTSGDLANVPVAVLGGKDDRDSSLRTRRGDDTPSSRVSVVNDLPPVERPSASALDPESGSPAEHRASGDVVRSNSAADTTAFLANSGGVFTASARSLDEAPRDATEVPRTFGLGLLETFADKARTARAGAAIDSAIDATDAANSAGAAVPSSLDGVEPTVLADEFSGLPGSGGVWRSARTHGVDLPISGVGGAKTASSNTEVLGGLVPQLDPASEAPSGNATLTASAADYATVTVSSDVPTFATVAQVFDTPSEANTLGNGTQSGVELESSFSTNSGGPASSVRSSNYSRVILSPAARLKALVVDRFGGTRGSHF